ncbi:MAG: sigma-70 family RNA polymerase sigma factor [Candidatus Omnitrophota bacterium]
MQDVPKETIIEASKGDMAAFRDLYNAVSGFVYNIVYRITNNEQDADEVTQDVFLKIYNKLGSFRFQSSFKTWIYRIAVNTAINAYRKRSREKEYTVEYNEDLEVTSDRNTPREETDKRSHEALLKTMLDMLNGDQRACVILKDIEGLKYEEIAKILGININTVRSRLKRAREALLTLKEKGVMQNGL